MNNIEDLIEIAAGIGVKVNRQISLGVYHRDTILDMAFKTTRGNALTQKQASYAISILKKYTKQLNLCIGKDVTPYLETPTYRLGIRKSNNTKTVGISLDTESIILNFPYDSNIIDLIRKYRDQLYKSQTFLPYANNEIFWDDRNWVFFLREEHIQFIASELLPLGFEADDLFLKYLEEINQIQKECENYIPVLSYDAGKFVYKNANANVPEIISQDLVGALFEAKRSAITIWDDSIQNQIDKSDIDKITMSVILDNRHISIPSDKPLSVLIPIVKNSKTCLFVVPGGNEFVCIEKLVNMLEQVGITQEEMSVLFRLPNKTHKQFNDFVKYKQLNNSLSENTRAVFIMGKLPKLVCQFDGMFDIIITLGNSNPNYMLKNYIKNHHCVISYNLLSTNKDLNFDNL